MSDEKQTYRVIRGAIRMPRGMTKTFTMSRADMVMQGELLPPGFDERDIKSWLAEGRIELAGVSEELAASAAEVRARNPFAADPSTLVGKTMEDLIIMVLEIEPEYDTDSLEDEAAAVRLLTSGWDPKYAQVIAPVNDRSRPEALALNALEQKGGARATGTRQTEMSAEAQAGLAAARAKAQAPADESAQ